MKFYFPNSEIAFKMEIHITGESPSAEDMAKASERKIPEPRKSVAPAPTPKDVPAKVEVPKKKDTPKKAEPEFIQLTLF